MQKQVNVLGIYGSPRKGGNTDQLLDMALEGAHAAGAHVSRIYARDLTMSGCIECGGCDQTGVCVLKDDMQSVYPLMEAADAVILACPIFFYGLTAQTKALVDRSQAMWSKRMLVKTVQERKHYDGGKGYLIAVGATRGRQLFDGVRLEAKYFFDALDMSYEGGLFFRNLEKPSDIQKQPAALQQAYDLGRKAATS
jgi:multimeric flavodoxin WrbA